MSTSQESRRRGFQTRSHDHQRCIDAALVEAQSLCTRKGARFTPLRRRVLEIVWQSHKPLGAYHILDILGRDGRSPAPPTVYRSLEFLLEQGLVHRIASLNAFVGCARPGHGGEGQFLICEACGAAAEMNDTALEKTIAVSADSLGFRAARQTLEVTGLCPSCKT